MRNYLLGIFTVLLVAATFNATSTRRSDLSHVDGMFVFKLADGGVGYTPALTVPTETTLPDAGLRVSNDIVSAPPCELINATARTNVLNFMNNQGQSCALTGLDLGN